MFATHFDVSLPPWLATRLQHVTPVLSVEERMRLVIALAQQNVTAGTGGPFGAAVFDLSSGALVSAGVNLVVRSSLSFAHTEIVAMALAQMRFETFDLSALPDHQFQLVSSAEPCGMCLGALHWSGLAALAVGARDEDVRAIGFDEGPKPTDWGATLAAKGIVISRDVCRQEAAAVLEEYKCGGGVIYNPGTIPNAAAAHGDS